MFAVFVFCKLLFKIYKVSPWSLRDESVTLVIFHFTSVCVCAGWSSAGSSGWSWQLSRSLCGEKSQRDPAGENTLTRCYLFIFLSIFWKNVSKVLRLKAASADPNKKSSGMIQDHEWRETIMKSRLWGVVMKKDHVKDPRLRTDSQFWAAEELQKWSVKSHRMGLMWWLNPSEAESLDGQIIDELEPSPEKIQRALVLQSKV